MLCAARTSSTRWARNSKRRRKITGSRSIACSPFIFLLGLYLCIFMFNGAPSEIGSSPSALSQVVTDGGRRKIKRILYYTSLWGDPEFGFGLGRQAFEDYGCPVAMCETVSFPLLREPGAIYDEKKNRQLQNLSEYDAVLFSSVSPDLDLTPKLRQDIAAWRQPHQRFVMMVMESPVSPFVKVDTNYDGFFNWTMTYRWDSDIPRPYGWFTRKENADNGDSIYPQLPPVGSWIPYNESKFENDMSPTILQKLACRKGRVAWIVSNCAGVNSRRDAYINQLSRYIQVDYFGNVHGSCPFAATPCDMPHSNTKMDNCSRVVSEEYKFYLAFENAFCDGGYVTEKLFKRMAQGLLPIAYGQADYNGGLVPPHSVISVLDKDENGRITVKSPKELAKLLHYLDNNDTAYLSYFWWQKHYQIHHAYADGAHRDNFGQAMCRLCEKLHDRRLPAKTYVDMVDWWKTSANCSRVLPYVEAAMMSDHFG